MGPFISSLTFVVIGFTLVFSVTFFGIFDHVELELGLEQYAEISWIPRFKACMPLNTLINVGYTALGLYWCVFTNTANVHGILKDIDASLFFTFNLFASLYGCVQMARIVTQHVIWAVLDQWCTLPFFALLPVWGLYYQRGWSTKRCLYIMTLSITSYVLTLITRIGFEISLGCHIVSAVYGGVLAYKKHPSRDALFSFYAALGCCSGFVVFKLLDFKLASLCYVFKYVSGHFISKICDIGQIYYVNEFFFDLSLRKAADSSVKDKTGWIARDKDSNDIRYENPMSLKSKKL